MIDHDKWQAIQRILGTTTDGIPGPNDDRALSELRYNALEEYRRSVVVAKGVAAVGGVRKSDGWAFTATVEGADIVVRNTTATWFGGDHDDLDNGETASGIRTKGNPDIMGCALPVLPQVRSTAGSPLPRIPWGTKVRVSHEGKFVDVDLIDNGPAKSAGDGIDLTVAVFKFFGVTLKTGVMRVDYRILGGAKYIA